MCLTEVFRYIASLRPNGRRLHCWFTADVTHNKRLLSHWLDSSLFGSNLATLQMLPTFYVLWDREPSNPELLWDDFFLIEELATMRLPAELCQSRVATLNR